MQSSYLFVFLLLLLSACQGDPSGDAEDVPVSSPASDYESADYKWGFANANGKLIIPARYDEVRNFGSEGLALVREGDRWYFIEANGQQSSKAFKMAWPYAEQRARVRFDHDSIGFVNQRGQIIIPPNFESAGDFNNGYTWAKQMNQYGILDHQGKTIVPFQYDKLSGGQGGEYIFRQNGKYGLLHADSGEFIPAVYEKIRAFGAQSFTPARRDGRYGYLDRAGQWQLSPQFLQAGLFNEGRAVVLQANEQLALIDSSGQNYLREPYQQVWYAKSGRWIVEEKGLYGAVDASGEIKIPLVFSELQSSSEGFMVYQQNELWGYLNAQTGAPLTPPAYGLAWPFNEGFARVATRQGISLIDTSGQLRFPPNYLDVKDGRKGLFPVQVIE
ncbi:MAG: WG repeat-containing protein [Bacteroidota bacterium]